MAEINLFRYIPGRSVLHALDPRSKLVSLFVLSFGVGCAQSRTDIFILSSLLGLAVACSRLPLGVFLRELRSLAWLILAALVLPIIGPSQPVPAAFAAGLLMAWRLLAALVIGLLLTGTTSATMLRAAIFWLLQLLPGFPARRVATMFSMVLTMVPLIFDQAVTIREAELSRGIDQSRNPLRRLSYLCWPILRQTFQRADELILAMESRCYQENPIRHDFQQRWSDIGILGLVMSVTLFVLLR